MEEIAFGDNSDGKNNGGKVDEKNGKAYNLNDT